PRLFYFFFEVFPFFGLCISEGGNLGLAFGSQIAPHVPRQDLQYESWHRSGGFRLLLQEYQPMNKENNCQCVVCNVEAALLDSFSTQKARTQFQAIASIHHVLNHFNSPIDIVEILAPAGGEPQCRKRNPPRRDPRNRGEAL